MSRCKTMIAAVIAAPGITGKEIAAALNLTTRDEIKSMSTQLSQLCKAQKLRKDSILTAGVSRPRYWPTALSTQDGRRDPKRHAARSAAAKRAATLRPQNTAGCRMPRHKQETRAVLRARIAAECKAAGPAHPKPQPRFIAPQRPATHPGPRGAQSVDEFIRLGGQIERLARHASSNPLQFDHSATDVPIRNRRPSIRVRPAQGR